MLGEGLSVDGFGGAAVLPGQPVVAQVQVDTGGLDGGVPSLGLDGLQCHAGFAQAGQPGVPQLVAGSVRQAGATAGSVEDLIEPRQGERLAASWSFQDAEDVTVSELVGLGGSLEGEVAGQGGEEPPGDRDLALVAGRLCRRR